VKKSSSSAKIVVLIKLSFDFQVLIPCFAPTHKLTLKEAAIFSDQISLQSGSKSDNGYPNGTYRNTFDVPNSISSKKYRSTLTKFRTIGRTVIPFNNLQQTKSSPIKPWKQTHIAISSGASITTTAVTRPLILHSPRVPLAVVSLDSR
jgi:hypothetical protein